MGENFKWPTTQKIENEKKGNGRLNICEHIPKQNFFEKKT